LQNVWTVWEHHKGGASNNYGTNMKKLGDFSTVEGFWRFFNHVPWPSQIFTTEEGSKRFNDREVEGISLFKRGIRPEWEDPRNMHGGEFFVRKQLNVSQLDQWWENLIMGTVGELIDPADVLCGVRIVDKSVKGKILYRLEIWFSCSEKSDRDLVERIKDNTVTAMNTSVKLEYKDHTTSISQGFAPAHGGGRR
jgi:translation initiation factor 4E